MNLPHVLDADIADIRSMDTTEVDALKWRILQTPPHEISEFTIAKPPKLGVEYIICPICGNGTGKDATPVDVHFVDNKWLYCCQRNCGFQGDLLSIIAKEGHLNLKDRDDFLKALAIGSALTNNAIFSNSNNPAQIQVADEKKKKQIPLILADINAPDNLDELPKSERRGLSLGTLREFKCVFHKKWTHPQFRVEGKPGYPSRRLIIPTKNHYNAVALPSDRESGKVEKAYWKQHAGAMELFNPDALTSDFVIITEGEIDAMTIWQATNGKFAVAAVLGVRNYKKTLIPLLKNKNLPSKNFLILFDRDQAGKDSAPLLKSELNMLGHRAAVRFLYNFLSEQFEANPDGFPFQFDEKIDANKILTSFPKNRGDYFLNDLINKIVDSAQVDFNSDDAKITAAIQPNSKSSADVDNQSDNILEDWQDDNGVIAPDTIKKLKKAKDWLDSLTPENITSDTAQNSKTKRAIALCQFFDCFSASANKFLAALETAKNNAVQKIKNAKEENHEPSFELQMLVQVSIRDIKAEIKPLITKIKKEHAQYQKELAYKKTVEKAAKKKQEQEKIFDDNAKQLKRLKAQPESKERNQQIIDCIKDMCSWRHDKNGDPVEIQATAKNLDIIFQNDPFLTNLFGYDEFKDEPVFLRPAVWRKQNCTAKQWTDIDDSELRVYLRRTYAELSNKELIFDFFTSYANQNSFHAVKEYFQKLPKWDGTKRMEEIFIKYLGAEDTPYVRAVTKNWLLAAIARIFHPGCEYQTALVLHGKQGIGKSFILKRLGGQWHKAITDRVDDPHAADTIKLVWLGEFKEMAGMRKAEINAIKQFIELPEDTRRFAYQRRATTIPRHCVFAITVNDEKFLNDKTGNRRYLIVHCSNAQGRYVAGLTDEVISQIWAEAYEEYNEIFGAISNINEIGAKLELSQEFRIQAEEITKQHINYDGADGLVQAFVNKKIPPMPIWELLTVEEKAEFFKSDCIKLLDAKSDLKQRIRSKGGQKVQAKLDALVNVFYDTKDLYIIRKKTIGGETLDEYWIYGTEYRQHICAKEIANECLGNKTPMVRVHEILSQLEGWTIGQRMTIPHYGDQRTVYYRNSDNCPEDNPNDETKNNSGTNYYEDSYYYKLANE